MKKHNKNIKLMLFGVRLRNKRSLKYSQKTLAKKIGISPNFISLIENCKRLPSLPLLYKIAIALDCSTDYLMGL